MAFHRDELTVPRELQVAAEIALSHRLLLALRSLEQETSDASDRLDVSFNYLLELEAIATEAHHLHCNLTALEAKQILERLIQRSLWQLLQGFNAETAEREVQRLERLLDLGQQLRLDLNLAQAQELYLHWLQSSRDDSQLHLLQLGQKLAVNVAIA